MFKDKRFNTIINLFLLVTISLTGVVLLIGERSYPRVYDINTIGQNDGITPVHTQIVLTFNRIMDRKSVLDNLKIEPAIDSNAAWVGRKLVLTPKQILKYDTEYRVILANATDSDGTRMQQTFSTSFKTKSDSIFFISQDEKTTGYLVKYDLGEKKSSNILSKNIESYSISSDGKNIVYAIDNEKNTSKVFYKNLETNQEKEINIDPKKLSSDTAGAKVIALVYGKQNIAMLMQGVPSDGQNFTTGRIIFIFDISTQQVSQFLPIEKLADSDVLLYTPDFQSLIFRDVSQNYAYLKIGSTDEPTIVGKYLSVNGLNPKQDKLLIATYDPSSPDFQYIAYVQIGNRLVQTVSRTASISLV